MFLTQIETQNIKLAMEVGGHDFEAIKEPLYTGNGVKVPDNVAVINSKTGAYLGTVGIGWEPVQPMVMWDLADELIKSTKGHINGVLNLRGGSVMGISFTLLKRQYVPKDPVDLNFLMLNSFDGTHCLAGHGITHRPVCLNQANTSNRVYNLRHTKNVLDKIEVVKHMLRYYQNEIKAFDKKMGKLVGKRISAKRAVNWFRSLFDEPNSKRAETTLDNQTAIFIDLLDHGRGSSIKGVKGTYYGAFQALTEYITHHRSTRVHQDREEGEVRFEAIHFGSGNELAQKGLISLSTPEYMKLAA